MAHNEMVTDDSKGSRGDARDAEGPEQIALFACSTYGVDWGYMSLKDKATAEQVDRPHSCGIALALCGGRVGVLAATADPGDESEDESGDEESGEPEMDFDNAVANLDNLGLPGEEIMDVLPDHQDAYITTDELYDYARRLTRHQLAEVIETRGPPSDHSSWMDLVGDGDDELPELSPAEALAVDIIRVLAEVQDGTTTDQLLLLTPTVQRHDEFARRYLNG